jgi:hypothetical protein
MAILQERKDSSSGSSTYRLVISINLLQRSVAVEIDCECLKPFTQNGIKSEAKENTVVSSSSGSHKTFRPWIGQLIQRSGADRFAFSLLRFVEQMFLIPRFASIRS